MKLTLIIVFISIVAIGIIVALVTSVNKGASFLDKWLDKE
jgi:Flp pilus assembly pilin Flp